MPAPDDLDPIQDAKHAREGECSAALTPAQALAAWEAADARKAAAKQEQYDADAAWVKAAADLGTLIDDATPEQTRRPTVVIAGKVVTVEWDGDYWTVSVQTPPVLGLTADDRQQLIDACWGMADRLAEYAGELQLDRLEKEAANIARIEGTLRRAAIQARGW